jgi:O-antigen/teichoic acid export membrane protein
VLGRLVSGSLANIYGQAINVVVQLLSVPLLAATWGVERYGQWLMLYTIPTYLLLSDIGFASASMADISWRLGRNDLAGARATYHSAKLLGMGMMASLMALAGATLLVLPWLIPQDRFVGPHSAAAVAWMMIYAGLCLQKTFTLSGLRASGYFAQGTLLDGTFYLFDGLAILVAAKLGADLAGCAAAATASRSVGNVLMWLLLRVRAPWLEKGYDGASWGRLRDLLGPALAIGALPLGLAVSMQGATVVLGALAGSALVAVFVATRTLSRIALQIGTIVNRVSVPELAFALGGGRRNHATTIMLMNIAVLAFVIVPIALILALFGKPIIGLWTLHRINPSQWLVVLLALSAMLQAIWWQAANLLTAVRLQTRFAWHFVVFSLLAIVLGALLSKLFGAEGMAGALTLLDLAMCFKIFAVLADSALVDRSAMQDQVKAMHGAIVARLRL